MFHVVLGWFCPGYSEGELKTDQTQWESNNFTWVTPETRKKSPVPSLLRVNSVKNKKFSKSSRVSFKHEGHWSQTHCLRPVSWCRPRRGFHEIFRSQNSHFVKSYWLLSTVHTLVLGLVLNRHSRCEWGSGMGIYGDRTHCVCGYTWQNMFSVEYGQHLSVFRENVTGQDVRFEKMGEIGSVWMRLKF